MATIEQSGGESLSLHPAIKLPHIPWTQILAISIFWLALNFHWTALGIIILPSQVFKAIGRGNLATDGLRRWSVTMENAFFHKQ